MNRLTKQEQLVLCICLGLLLTGWAVKAYRTAHPQAAPKIQLKSNLLRLVLDTAALRDRQF